MLFELLTIAGGAVYGIWGYANHCAKNQVPPLLQGQPPKHYITSVPKPKQPEPSTDVLRLIVELIRSDEGWNMSRDSSDSISHDFTFSHETGTKIVTSYYHKSGRKTIIVAVLDEKGAYERVEVNADDKLILEKELEAYNTRATDRRQRELARSLAKRIVGGPVPSVLGGTDVPRLPSSRDDDSEQHGASSTGLLSYDAQTKRIVASVRGDNVQLKLDASLQDRYAVRKTSKYSDTLRKYMDERDFTELYDEWGLERK